MSNITMSSRYQRGYNVRMRQVGDETFLIRLTNICKLDSFCIALWELLDGSRNFYQLVLELCARPDSAGEENAIEMAANNVINLLKLGYIYEADHFTNEFSKTLFKSTKLSCLDLIMQSFYFGEISWFAEILLSDKERIRSRFFRILYEMESSRRQNNGGLFVSEEDFVGNIFVNFVASERDCISLIKDTYELKGWRFDMQGNSITIVYMATVYFGDLDNRL